MLDEHLPLRQAALIGLNLFDHILDALAIPITARIPEILPLVLLSLNGKLCWVKGSLKHPLPFSGLNSGL